MSLQNKRLEVAIEIGSIEVKAKYIPIKKNEEDHTLIVTQYPHGIVVRTMVSPKKKITLLGITANDNVIKTDLVNKVIDTESIELSNSSDVVHHLLNDCSTVAEHYQPTQV